MALRGQQLRRLERCERCGGDEQWERDEEDLAFLRNTNGLSVARDRHAKSVEGRPDEGIPHRVLPRSAEDEASHVNAA
jgi:hypothetical protein